VISFSRVLEAGREVMVVVRGDGMRIAWRSCVRTGDAEHGSPHRSRAECGHRIL